MKQSEITTCSFYKQEMVEVEAMTLVAIETLKTMVKTISEATEEDRGPIESTRHKSTAEDRGPRTDRPSMKQPTFN